MDEDLAGMSREQLVDEFLRGCVTYRQSLDEQAPGARSSQRYEG